MTKCSKCNRSKLSSSFSVKPSGRANSWCKSCVSRNSKEWYLAHRETQNIKNQNTKKNVIFENQRNACEYLLQHPCSCGEQNPVLLEFDHDNPSEKDRDVCQMIHAGIRWPRILSEILKCTVRCVKCHRMKTAEAMLSFRFMWWARRESNSRGTH